MTLPPVLVTIPISETQDQRRERERLRQPLPHISYVAHSVGYVAQTDKNNPPHETDTI